MNSLVQAHLAQVPNDPRTPEQITMAYGTSPLADQYLKNYPDFAAEFHDLQQAGQNANQRDLVDETSAGFSRGASSLGSSLYGALALTGQAVGSQGLRDYGLAKAQESDENAAENAPSVPTYGDIKDASGAAHYVAGKLGELAPNVVEAGVTGAIGAAVGGAAGGAVDPAGGEIPGAAGGALYGLLEGQAVKGLIRQAAEKGINATIEDFSPEMVSGAVKALGSKYGTHLAETANFWAQSAGSTYNQLVKNPDVDPSTALNVSIFGGLAQALPSQYLPSYVLGKTFGAEAPSVGGYFARLGQEAVKTIPGGIAAMNLQELASIASDKYADPKTRDEAFDFSSWSKADKSRLVESSVMGGLAGLIGAPLAALRPGEANKKSLDKAKEDAKVEAAKQIVANTGTPPPNGTTSAEAPLPNGPATPAVNPLDSYTAGVTPERKIELAQLAERQASGTTTSHDRAEIKTLTPEEQNQLSIFASNVAAGGEMPGYSSFGDHSDLISHTDLPAITSRPHDTIVHPELSNDEILAALDAKKEAANVPQAVAQTPEPNPNIASVPVMITRRMNADLLARGLKQSDIDKLTPQQAHEVLNNPPQPAVDQPAVNNLYQGVYADLKSGKSTIGGLPADSPITDKLRVEYAAGRIKSAEDVQAALQQKVDQPVNNPAVERARAVAADVVSRGESPVLPVAKPVKQPSVHSPDADERAHAQELITAKENPPAEPPAPVAIEVKPVEQVSAPAPVEAKVVAPEEPVRVLGERGKENKGPIINPDTVDFENTGLVAKKSGKGVNREIKGAGIEKTFEPAYFEITPEESKNPKALGERLVSGASYDKTKAYQDSHRVTVVQDKQTGKVLMLSTFREREGKGGEVKLANPDKIGKTQYNMTLPEMLDKKTDTGEQRYVPIASMRLNYSKWGLVQEFANRETYDKSWGDVVKKRAEKLAATMQSNSDALVKIPAEGGLGAFQEPTEHQETGEEVEHSGGEITNEDTLTSSSEGEDPVERQRSLDQLKSEGWTEKHAKAILDMFGREKEEPDRETFDEMFRDNLTDDPNAIDAVRQALASLAASGLKLSPKEALEIVRNHIYESIQEGYRNGEEAFKRSASERFGGGNAGDAGSGVQEARNEKPVQEQASTGRSAAQQQQGGQGGYAVTNPAPVAKSEPLAQGVQQVSPEHAQLLDNIHQAAIQGGLNVQRIAQDMSAAAGDVAKLIGGSYDEAHRLISQVVSSVVGKADVIVALHEVAHDVFANLPEAERTRIVEAIKGISDRALGLDTSFDKRINEANPAGLPDNNTTGGIHAERLVQVTAQRLQEAGFNPAKANSYAQSFVRAIKDLYYRGSMAIQRALFGDEFTNGELAQKYFENKVKQFLSGDANRSSFIDMLGGGKPSQSHWASWRDNKQVGFERIGSDGKSIDYQHVPDDSLENIKLNNLAFSRPDPNDDVTRSRTTEIEKRAALLNHMAELYDKGAKIPEIAEAAKAAKMDPQQYLGSLFGLVDTNAAKQTLHGAVEAGGKEPVDFDPNKTIDGFKAESNQAEVTRNAYTNTGKMLSKVARKESQSKTLVETLKASKDRALERYETLKNNYENWQGNTTEAGRAMREDLKDFFKDTVGTSKRLGAITQQLKFLDPLTPIKKYLPAMKHLLESDALKGNNFYNLLDKVSNDEKIDFSKSITKIRDAMSKDPAYAALTQNTDTSRALLATVTAMAKTHERILTNMEQRRVTDGETRNKIKASLDELRKKASFSSEIRDLARTAKLEDRARRAHSEALSEVKRIDRRLQKAQATVDAAKPFGDMLRKESDRLGAKLSIGADAVWRDGMLYNVPKSPDASSEDVLKNVKKLTLSGKDVPTAPAEVEAHLRQMSAWMANREAAAHAGDDSALDGVYQGVKRQRDEMAANKNFKLNQKASDKLGLELMMTADGERLGQGLNTPAAQTWMQSISRFVSDKLRLSSLMESRGTSGQQLKDNILALFPAGRANRASELEEKFLNPVRDTLEHSDDLEERYAGNESALKAALWNRVMGQLTSNSATKDLIGNNVGEWRKRLSALIDHQRETNEILNTANKEGGLGVEDPRVRVINPATGKVETGVRDQISKGYYTFSRRISQVLRDTVNGLRNSGWAVNDEEGKSLAKAEFSKIAAALDSNDPAQRAQAEQIVGKYFNNPEYGHIVKDFVGQLAQMDKVSHFDAPAMSDGITKAPADTELSKQAWNESGGDAIKFFERLWDLHDGKPVTDEDGNRLESKNLYVQNGLLRLADTAQEIHKMMEKAESTSTDEFRSIRTMTSNPLIHARQIEHLPGAWFDYHSYDRNDLHRMAEKIAASNAFGRDNERLAAAADTMKMEVNAAKQRLANAYREVQENNPTVQNKLLNKALDKLVAAKIDKESGAGTFDNLKKLAKRAPMVQDSVRSVADMFRRNNSPEFSVQAAVRAGQTIGGLIVNNPASALNLMSQIADIPIALGASKSTAGAIGKGIVYLGKEAVGSLAQAVGVQLFRDDRMNRLYNDLGFSDPAAVKRFRDAFDNLEGEGGVAHVFRGIQDITGRGINAVGDKAEHTIFRPLQPFQTMALAVNKATTMQVWKLVADHIGYGKRFLEANIDKLNDPGYKLSAEDLGLKGGNKDTFTKLNNMMGKWGMSLTDMARASLQRDDGTPFTNQEAARLYSMAVSHVALEGNLATMPAWAYNNSIMKIALPLLGWSLRRANQVGELRLDAEGQNSAKALVRGLGGLALAGAGGLATAALVDQYYQTAIGKQRNIRPITGSQDGGDLAMSLLENLNRVGTAGIYGELVNGLVNVGQGGDNRDFSVDQRVVAISSFQALMKAASAFINQGYNADYAHVMRPTMNALGGSGLLQYVQLANNSLGLDNAESRMIARMNAQNYLRVVGRELGMEVRTFDGGTSTPTPITPYVTQMELAAYKNNPADFRQAYAAAVQAAKDQGHDDPVKYIQQTFESHHPLKNIFRTTPTGQDYQKLLSNMPGSGRQDVSQAVNLFNQYTESIGGKAFDGKVVKPSKAPTSPQNAVANARKMAAASLN